MNDDNFNIDNIDVFNTEGGKAVLKDKLTNFHKILFDNNVRACNQLRDKADQFKLLYEGVNEYRQKLEQTEE